MVNYILQIEIEVFFNEFDFFVSFFSGDLFVHSILFLYLICFIIPLVLSSLNYFFFYDFNIKECENLLIYECGFIPFTSRHLNFRINFHVVALLFIIFDLEVVLIFPWCISFVYLGLFGYFVMMIFLLILVLGIYLEIKSNILSLEINEIF